MIMKKCSKCKESKSLIEFNKNRHQKDGADSYCKQCRNIYNSKRLTTGRIRGKSMYISPDQKTCSICNQARYVSEFNKQSRTRDGLKSYCRECQSRSREKYQARILENVIIPNTKPCSKCRLVKSSGQFGKNRTSPDGLKSLCKNCESMRASTGMGYNKKEYVERKYRKPKRKFVELAGGHCQRCGYKEFLPGLEFHHVDPDKKTDRPSSLIYRDFDVAYQELDKCCLLCRNCHMSFEHDYWQAEFIKRDGLGYTIKK